MAKTVQELAREYMDFDEDSILIQVGQRVRLGSSDPLATSLPPQDFTVEYQDLSFASDARELGRRLARRVFRELHEVLCGDDADDKEDRERIRSAFGVSDEAVAAAVAAVLAGPLGLGGAIAAALAALFVKRLLGPTIQETCSWWSEKLAEV